MRNVGDPSTFRELAGPFSLTEAFAWSDLLAPFRALFNSASDLWSLLFPAPSAAEVEAVVYADGWQGRIAAGSKLASPERMAHVVASGMIAGHDQQQIARELLPVVQGVQSSARRIARTEGLRVAAATQMQAHRELGDLVVGHQVHATLDQNTRPAHAARSGTVYYASPGPGQLGYDAMPSPPQEADGSTAWNCRCYLSPVLRDPGKVAGFAPPAAPDPLVYSDWWAQADERRRRIAVGSKRYSLVRDSLGAEPEWAHFLASPEGNLARVEDLAAETATARAERLAKVNAQLAHRRLLARQVSQFGTL